jgi:GNAT superfamily N-acetyltransferase
MSMRVRPSVPEDAEAIAALATELRRLMRDPHDLFTAERIRAHGFGEDRHVTLLVAELDDEIVGYAAVLDAYSTEYGASGLYLQDLHVTERARRRGTGKALLAGVSALARRRERRFVWWCSKIWNHEAHAFYRALGAVDEPIMAHALYGDAFERLAAEGMAEPEEEPTARPRDAQA